MLPVVLRQVCPQKKQLFFVICFVVLFFPSFRRSRQLPTRNIKHLSIAIRENADAPTRELIFAERQVRQLGKLPDLGGDGTCMPTRFRRTHPSVGGVHLSLLRNAASFNTPTYLSADCGQGKALSTG